MIFYKKSSLITKTCNNLATNTLWRDDSNHKLITRQQSEFKQLTDGCYV